MEGWSGRMLRDLAERDLRKCRLFGGCFCLWCRHCSDRIPRVEPRMEYLSRSAYGEPDRIPRVEPRMEYVSRSAYGEPLPVWSVLIGCTSFGGPWHNVRLHRFRVTDTGRVTGCSNDMLECIRSVSPHDSSPVEDKPSEFYSTKAALGPDSKHLYLMCVHRPMLRSDVSSDGRAIKTMFPPKVVSMDMDDLSLSSMRSLPFTGGSYLAISAHGGVWVPVILTKEVDKCSGECTRQLFIYQLVGDDGGWEKVANVNFQHRWSAQFGYGGAYGGSFVQGFAVMDDRYILLSLINSSFYCFDCANGILVPVLTAEGESHSKYVPISGKGVHFEDAIVFIRDTRLFVYRFNSRSELAPPLVIDTLWPYRKEGYGFVVHLTGRILCAVWINMNLLCGCSTRHVLITTFIIRHLTVQVLHSTCRRIDMLRTVEPGPECFDSFSFLQEYLDTAPRFSSASSNRGGFTFNEIHRVQPSGYYTDGGAWFDSSVPSMRGRYYPDGGARFDSSVPSMLGGFRDTPQVDRFPERMPDCCREFLSRKRGIIFSLEDCNVATRSDLYFICQVDQRSLVYQVSISGVKLACDENALDALLCLDTVRPGDVGLDVSPAWFFVHHGAMLDVIPSLPHCDHYAVDVERKCYNIQKNKRSKLFFSAVFRVGEHTVALCHTLQDVYVLNRNNFQWRRQKTSSRSLDLSHKVKISGFVDLGDGFMISDAETAKCFLFDLKKGEWFAVKPPKGRIWQSAVGLLNGRSIFAEGFIYTCSAGGLIAFELIDEDDSYCLGEPIRLNSSWEYCLGERKFLSFDSICKGEIDSSIVFCVVQGCPIAVSCIHKFAATTVHVKLEKTQRETKKPISIDRVGTVSSSIDQYGTILTNYAFAV